MLRPLFLLLGWPTLVLVAGCSELTDWNTEPSAEQEAVVSAEEAAEPDTSESADAPVPVKSDGVPSSFTLHGLWQEQDGQHGMFFDFQGTKDVRFGGRLSNGYHIHPLNYQVNYEKNPVEVQLFCVLGTGTVEMSIINHNELRLKRVWNPATLAMEDVDVLLVRESLSNETRRIGEGEKLYNELKEIATTKEDEEEPGAATQVSLPATN